MQQPYRKTEALIRRLDLIIERHGATNPELLRDLSELRTQLLAAASRGPLEYAQIAVRVSTWVKFILDHLPPH